MLSNEIKRETVVRGLSRGGDLAIANSLMLIYGDTYFLYATAFGAVWNGLTDFIGQRYWTYSRPPRSGKRLMMEVVPYATLRVVIAILGISTLTTMFFVFSLPYYVGSLTTTAVFWFISYKVTRVFFTGSSHGLPKWFRSTWVTMRLAARKKVRS